MEVANQDGDLLDAGNKGGIKGGVRGACAVIVADWRTHQTLPPVGRLGLKNCTKWVVKLISFSRHVQLYLLIFLLLYMVAMSYMLIPVSLDRSAGTWNTWSASRAATIAQSCPAAATATSSPPWPLPPTTWSKSWANARAFYWNRTSCVRSARSRRASRTNSTIPSTTSPSPATCC